MKNIFELKNARNVVVEDNLFENHWRESQPGYAIVLTPRNSQGKCTWCVVEHVRFERNVVRNVAAAINLLGYDGGSPSRQAADITFRQNLFTLTTTLGGNGWFMQIGDGPRDVVLDHNTVDSNGTTVVYAYGGSAADPREVYGFKMIANAARHGTYGINGQYFASGNAIITAYFPSAVFERNYLAGGSAARLPAGTIVTNYFQDQFVNSAAGDYTVRTGSLLDNAALDGSDVGVDYPELMLSLAGVQEGRPPLTGSQLPTAPVAAFTEACTFLGCTFTEASVQGTAAIASRTWSFGDGTAPVSGGSLDHQFAQAGTYSVMLTVIDAGGLGSIAEKTIPVTAPVPPAAALTLTCVFLTCDFGDGSTAGSFPIASRSWSFGDGSAMTNGEASGTHVFALAGTYLVTLTVADEYGLFASASRSVTVAAPNLVPTAAFTAACADLTCTFTDASSDLDGTITGWSWASGAGTSALAAPTFTFAAPGSYPVTLTATDDDGATASVTTVVTVTARLHAAYAGTTLKWSSASGQTSYWSANVTVSLHGLDERLIAGASVTAAWSGAVVKTVTCVTNAAGSCTFKSGTLSYLRSTVTLNVTSVVSAAGVYIPTGNHTTAGVPATALTLARP